jgi:RNA methyltransferase, TrmH family
VSPPASALSIRNPNVQRLRRLTGRRRARRDEGRFVIEGPGLIAEALRSSVPIETAFVAADERGRAAPREVLSALARRGIETHDLAPGVLERVTDTVTPQGVVAVAVGRPLRLDEFVTAELAGLVVVLAGLGDPGNAGTLVRTAEATGAAGVVFTDGTVDPLAPKTVRAAAGSAFRVRLVDGGPVVGALEALGRAGLRLVGASVGASAAATDYTEAPLDGDVAVVLGSEPRGLGHEVVSRVDEVVSIPMLGEVESLNVAVAGSLLCFEYARRRTR